MVTKRCSSCDKVDFQYRYAAVVFVDNTKGQLCAECFDEWLGVDRSRRKSEFSGLDRLFNR